MTYEEALSYLNETEAAGIVFGLENIRALCKQLGEPQNKFSIVHVTGTNGKGTVSALIEAALTHAGHKTGRFSSPAVYDRLECITCGGAPITRDDYARCISDVAAAAHRSCVSPTVFEIETAAAYRYFELCGCDIAVIEVGMGGRLDATNVNKKCEVCVFTHIDADHSAYLGADVSDIAAEKAGIIKPGCTAVTYPQCDEVKTVLMRKCSENGAELKICEKPDIIRSRITGTEFTIPSLPDVTFKIRLAGDHQAQNAALAAAVCAELDRRGIHVGTDAMLGGFASVTLPGRFEILCTDPLFIADGAHNPDACAALAKNITRYSGVKRVAFILGILRDKDYKTVCRITAPLAEHIYCITPPSPRALDADALLSAVLPYNSRASAHSARDAVTLAVKGGYDAVVSFGTFTTIKQIKEILQECI